MKYRTDVLLDAEDVSTAATKTIDIDSTDPISRIEIVYKATNNNSVPTAHPTKMITNLSVVDGSDVLFSLSGIEAQALNYLSGTMSNPLGIAYANDVQAITTIGIDFGRWLYDADLALDPNKFKNLQLKITQDKSLGASTPDAATMSIYAHQFDEKRVSPTGFLMSKEAYTYTLVASATQSIDLPTDYPMRKLIVQSLAAGKQPWEQYNKLTLSEDQDKRIPINNMRTSDLLKMEPDTTKIVENVIGVGTGSAAAVYCTPTYATYVAISSLTSALSTVATTQAYGGYFTVNTDSAELYQSVITGFAPHGALNLLHHDEYDMNDWYDVGKLKSLKLKVVAGSGCTTSSTAQIVTQQLRRY